MDSESGSKWYYTIFMAQDGSFIYENDSECFGFDTKEDARSALDKALKDPFYAGKDVYGTVREEYID